ncbi:DAPG hydrolase family protein [Streptomyces sp. NPDC048254]|uniref:DAPG hydrolase family protein n=1 Tax=Streptomyces sp. NPDC048254 TaxID=3365525 RepID=UPI003713B111
MTKRRELSPEERRLPLVKYWDLPLHRVGPLQRQLIESMPMDPSRATKPENWLDVLQPTGYQDTEYGYCMREDGTGYLAVYTTYPGCTPAMLRWYFHGINVHSKSTPPNQGNIRYKIWNQADHWDHGYINGKDRTDGISPQRQAVLRSRVFSRARGSFRQAEHPSGIPNFHHRAPHLQNEMESAGQGRRVSSRPRGTRGMSHTGLGRRAAAGFAVHERASIKLVLRIRPVTCDFAMRIFQWGR